MKNHVKISLYAVLVLYAFITVYPSLLLVSAKPLRESVGGDISLFSPNLSFDRYVMVYVKGGDKA